MTLTDDIYNYIISGDFKPEDDPTTFDDLMNMLNVDSSRTEELMGAMQEWMMEMMDMDYDFMPTYDEVNAFLEG